MLNLPFFTELNKSDCILLAGYEALVNQLGIDIVSSSILSSVAGHYGDHHATPRTAGSKLWINPLKSVYWCFQLSHVANRLRYLEG